MAIGPDEINKKIKTKGLVYAKSTTRVGCMYGTLYRNSTSAFQYMQPLIQLSVDKAGLV